MKEFTSVCIKSTVYQNSCCNRDEVRSSFGKGRQSYSSNNDQNQGVQCGSCGQTWVWYRGKWVKFLTNRITK